MGYDDQNRPIRDLLPEVSGTFNVERFKKEVLAQTEFEQQIEVFDKYFNLWIKRDLTVKTMEGVTLFSIYCSCEVCRKDDAIYSLVKEDVFKKFLIRKYKALKQEFDKSSNYVEKVLIAERNFGVYTFEEIIPFDGADEDCKVSVFPKTLDERREWTAYLLSRYNEEYFFNQDYPNTYKQSYDQLRDDFDTRLENALYPKELIEQEILEIKSQYENPSESTKHLSYFNSIGTEQFRELVEGKPFDLIGFGKWNTIGLKKVEVFNKYCYLRYLESIKHNYLQPLKGISTNLPHTYIDYAREVIKTFIRGFSSKDTYSDLEEKASHISSEQAHEFFGYILNGLQTWLTDHRKAVGSVSLSKYAGNVEQAIGLIQERMLSYESKASITAQSGKSILDETLSNSQIVLLIYYMFKIFGLEPRKGLDITQFAKLAHLLTGRELTKINNSDFYQKFKAVPNFKQDKSLIEDLEVIKPYFIKAQLKEAVKMIDNEIYTAKAERMGKQ